jgi:outer membrane biosynthesis protein TonB
MFSVAFCLGALASVPATAEAPHHPAPPGPEARAPDGTERQMIGETIRSQLTPLNDCYARRLERRPSLQGKLMLRFEIGPDGKVANPSANGIDDSDLLTCVLERVAKWQFDKPAAGAVLRVTYPVSFRAS